MGLQHKNTNLNKFKKIQFQYLMYIHGIYHVYTCSWYTHGIYRSTWYISCTYLLLVYTWYIHGIYHVKHFYRFQIVPCQPECTSMYYHHIQLLVLSCTTLYHLLPPFAVQVHWQGSTYQYIMIPVRTDPGISTGGSLSTSTSSSRYRYVP
jgi:hypothetical protein